MTGRRSVLASLGAAAIVLAGCASPGGAAYDPKVPQAATAASYWSGRFAVTVTESGHETREERASGRFVLESLGPDIALELFSPLGQTLASARIDSSGASLVASDGQHYQAASAELLTEQVVGWRVPVGDLPRWLRGELERPDTVSAGRPVSGMERGWTIRMENWQPAGPRRLALEWPARPDQAGRRISVRLIVDNAH